VTGTITTFCFIFYFSIYLDMSDVDDGIAALEEEVRLVRLELSRARESCGKDDEGGFGRNEVVGLERQLMLAKLEFVEAKFERESLQAEVDFLTQRVRYFAAPRPKPGVIRRVEVNAAEMDEVRRNLDRTPKIRSLIRGSGGVERVGSTGAMDLPEVQVGVVILKAPGSDVPVDGQGRPGWVGIDRDMLRVGFDPALGEEGVDIVGIDRTILSVSQLLPVDPATDRGARQMKLKKLRIRRGPQLPVIELVGVETTMQLVHDRLQQILHHGAFQDNPEVSQASVHDLHLPVTPIGKAPYPRRTGFGASIVERIARNIKSQSRDFANGPTQVASTRPGASYVNDGKGETSGFSHSRTKPSGSHASDI